MFQIKNLLLLLLLLFGVGAWCQPSLGPVKTTHRVLSNTCEAAYFLKNFYTLGAEVTNSDLAILHDNTIVSAGHIRNYKEDDFTDALLIKTDPNGTKLWEKIFGGIGHQAFNRITTSNDGNILAAGVEHLKQDFTLFLTKIDTDGNVLWKKNYQFNHGVNFTITAIREDADGSIYLSANYIEGGLSFRDNILFIRIDKEGKLVYSKAFFPPDEIRVLFAHSFIIEKEAIYLSGNYHSYYNMQGLLMKIDKKSGLHQWVRYYDLNNGAADFRHVLKMKDDRLCMIGVDDFNITDTSLIVVTDLEGNVESTSYLHQEGYRRESKAVIDKEDRITLAQLYYRMNDAYGSNLNLVKFHPVKGLEWSRNYNQIKGFPYVNGLSFGRDSSLFISGVNARHDSTNIFMGRFAKWGEIGCEPEMVNARYARAQSKAKDVFFKTIDVGLPSVIRSWENVNKVIEGEQMVCNLKNSCTALRLSGVKPLCGLLDTIVVSYSKNARCISVPQLAYDAQFLKLVEYTGMSAKFIALKSGTSKVVATIDNGCDQLQDEIEVVVYNAQGKVMLGADTTLCTSNTLLLNAGKGYQSYLWQDGATDSTYRVKVAGTYHVQAVDGCGNTFKDTIRVNAAPPIPFSLGADRSKCNQDTIQLTAPSGFINYRWSTAGNSTLGNAATLIVNPVVGTTYFLQAEKTLGCFAYDTIQVTVNLSPAIALGKDTTFCAGDSLRLDAGDGFSRYLWDAPLGDGQERASLVAKAKGAYSVQAWDDMGCVSKDTLLIREVFIVPTIALNKDSSLCMGTTRTLNAGNGFAAYQWSTGAITPSITVQQTGFYKVQVRDRNGCSAVDSVQIKKLLPLPSAFLPADVQVCAYESLLLKPNAAFKQYQWSNGATGSQITVSAAGLYWLEVTDANNCKGRDTMMVSIRQGCISGFHVPTAFTPGRDGKNDVFRPLIFGEVKQYQFTVYNRWGEVVFRSSEVGKGWDGKLLGKPQDTNVFVWTCVYQINGAEIKSEKGAVTLLR